MASSGWQGEQTLYNYSSNVHFIGNIRVDGITHSGSSLRVWGAVALGARGTSGYSAYYNYGIEENAGWSGWNKIVGNGQSIRVGGGDYYAGFDVTFGGVSPSTTSYSFPVEFKACYNSGCSSTYWDVTKYWTIYFDQSGSAPSGGYIDTLSSTWNTVTGRYGVTSDGGLSLSAIEFKVLKSAYVAGVPSRQYNASTSSIGPRTVTVTNSSPTTNNPTWTIQGCGLYHTGIYAQNSMGVLRYQGPTLYTPPAPGQFSYTDPGGSGTKVFPVEFTGVVANNNTDYDPAELTRSVRYQIDDGAWTWVTQAVTALDAVTSFNVSVPAGSTATIEGWMNYQGLPSETSTITLANNNLPSVLYGSVNGQSKEIKKLYGSVNGQTKEIKKLYASVGGVTKKIFEAS